MITNFIQFAWLIVTLLFVCGIYYLVATTNLIRVLIGIEILIKTATLVIILAGYVSGRTALAQTFVITLIVVEVVIMVVAIGLILNLYRQHGSIDAKNLKGLKG